MKCYFCNSEDSHRAVRIYNGDITRFLWHCSSDTLYEKLHLLLTFVRFFIVIMVFVYYVAATDITSTYVKQIYTMLWWIDTERERGCNFKTLNNRFDSQYQSTSIVIVQVSYTYKKKLYIKSAIIFWYRLSITKLLLMNL